MNGIEDAGFFDRIADVLFDAERIRLGVDIFNSDLKPVECTRRKDLTLDRKVFTEDLQDDDHGC